MRPLEWLLVLSFAFVLVLPFVPHSWRRRWLVVIATVLPTMVGLFQLSVEGWRVQIVPLYVLSILIVIGRIPDLLGQRKTLQRRRGILVAGMVALTVSSTIVLAGVLLPVVVLPEPTGPYQVGVSDRELTDAKRGRRLMVSVWYPAAQGGTSTLLIQRPQIVIGALADYFGFPKLALQHLRYFTVAAHTGAAVQVDSAPFPIFIFSHGMGGLRMQNSSTPQELASWGYIVVAVDHTDAAAIQCVPGW